MKARALLVGGLLVLASCAVGERPTLTDEPLGAGTSDAATAEGGETDGTSAGGDASPLGPGEVGEDEPDPNLPTLEALGEVPPVLLSPTGVLVPVLSRTDVGYLVRTPCGAEVELLWGQPIREAQVVIDAGHGGDEPGAIGPSGATEAEVNFDIAQRVATLLQSQQVSVVLARTGDYRVPIRTRAAIADQLGAAVFVSIHHNAPTPDNTTGQPGTEVYVQAQSPESQRLGGLVYEEVLGALSVFDVAWASFDDAGVLTVLNDAGEDAYGINRHPTSPAVLLELAYLSNPAEAELLATGEYRQAAAGAVASGIVRYLQTADPGSGFVAEPRLFNPAGSTGGGGDGCVDPPLS